MPRRHFLYWRAMSTESEVGYSRKNPFPASLTVNHRLTGEASNKDTRHFEVGLAGSGLTYEVGDSLGVFPSNDPELVDLLLRVAGYHGDEVVATPDGGQAPLREALTKNYIITEPSKQLLQAVPQRDSSAEFLTTWTTDPAAKSDLETFLWGRDVLDILEEFTGARFAPEEFVKLLRKLQPRLYSIASSQKAVGESVHLTVTVVDYVVGHSPRPRGGVCSKFLAQRAENGVPVFVHTAKHFRLPEDPSARIIMVGPGTGIAPFRAFLQERRATGARGENWLFFGEQHAASDFLYQDELEAAVKEGLLTKLTTAFSRDQAQKIYVQHRMIEHGADIFRWIQEGAFFYVCGDAKNMAKDVEGALCTIAESHGGMTPEQAKEFVEALKKEKRYRKDVY
jgi:sulfite reductase (NADPH) flavoprotein alpha-component